MFFKIKKHCKNKKHKKHVFFYEKLKKHKKCFYHLWFIDKLEQHQAAADPQTKPPDLGCVLACIGSYSLQPPWPFIIITQPESWYSFTVPRRVEGWVDLGTAGKVHTARAQGCKTQRLYDKHNCPQRDSIPGPHVLQSGMLPLDRCDLRWWSNDQNQNSWPWKRYGHHNNV